MHPIELVLRSLSLLAQFQELMQSAAPPCSPPLPPPLTGIAAVLDPLFTLQRERVRYKNREKRQSIFLGISLRQRTTRLESTKQFPQIYLTIPSLNSQLVARSFSAPRCYSRDFARVLSTTHPSSQHNLPKPSVPFPVQL